MRRTRVMFPLVALSLIGTSAFAADPDVPPRRGGMALAIELGAGGDSLEPISDTRFTMRMRKWRPVH